MGPAGAGCAGGQSLGHPAENSVVPPGLESFLRLFPALKRWAKLVRPSGAGLPCRAALSWDGRAGMPVSRQTNKPLCCERGFGLLSAFRGRGRPRYTTRTCRRVDRFNGGE